MLKVWFQSLKINKYFYLFKTITFWNLKKKHINFSIRLFKLFNLNERKSKDRIWPFILISEYISITNCTKISITSPPGFTKYIHV